MGSERGLDFDQAAKEEIFEELSKDYISGITFSGGDPLHVRNAYDVKELAKEIREKFPQKTIWLYTGSLWEEIKNTEIVKYLDVLVDGEFECDKKRCKSSLEGKRKSESHRCTGVSSPRESDLARFLKFHFCRRKCKLVRQKDWERKR